MSNNTNNNNNSKPSSTQKSTNGSLETRNDSGTNDTTRLDSLFRRK